MLSSVQIEVIFRLFDADDNGTLSVAEFVKVMEPQMHVGPMTEPGRMEALLECCRDCWRGKGDSIDDE